MANVVKKSGYDNGYNDAIEEIKKMLSQGSSSGSGGQETIKPKDMNDIPSDNKSSNGSGSSQGSNSNKSNGSQSGQGSNPNKPKDEEGRGKGSTGYVSEEDVEKIDEPTGNTPGGMIDRSKGEDIEKKEGHTPEGGSDAAEEKEWSETAIRESSKLKGDKAGGFKSKILNIYKTSTDWKKILKKIVGMSISEEDTRKAWANKNVLVTQNRLAKTDKEKYDNIDYMVAFIDSSGSMSDDQLKLCLSEVLMAAQAKKPIDIVVVQCDTKIQEIQSFSSVDELKKYLKRATVKGRGGTELKPCWDLLANDKRFKQKSAELVMVFTDGYLTQYKRNKKTMENLVWVILDNPGWECDHKESYTKTIHLNTKDIK